MIPKIIHFCWLSGDEYPPLIKHCIDTWSKVLPDYEIILWDANRFDIDSVPWVKTAFATKKYAFAADYIRFYALYNYGGIYLDSDVEVLKSFNSLLNAESFMGFEASTDMFEPAIVGAKQHTQWCAEVLKFYHNRNFNANNISQDILLPRVVAVTLESLYPTIPVIPVSIPTLAGQGNITLYPSHYFSPIKYSKDKCYSSFKDVSKQYYSNEQTYAIHRFNASWAIKPSKFDQFKEYVRKNIKNCLYKILGVAMTENIVDFIKRR